MKCSYPDCGHVKRCSSFCSYFSIPDDHRKVIWMKHSGQTKLDCKKAHFCEKHFYTKDIIVRGTHKCLKKNAVPISNSGNCKCTENVFDKDCFQILNSMFVSVNKSTHHRKNIIINKPLLLPTTENKNKLVHPPAHENSSPKSIETKNSPPDQSHSIKNTPSKTSELPTSRMNIPDIQGEEVDESDSGAKESMKEALQCMDQIDRSLAERTKNQQSGKNNVPGTINNAPKTSEMPSRSIQIEDLIERVLNRKEITLKPTNFSKQSGGSTIIDTPSLCPTTKNKNNLVHPPKSHETKNYLPEKSGAINKKPKTSELPNCSINIEEQKQLANDQKKIECLEAVIEYTSQMQAIVKQKGGLNSFIQANYHLIKLLDKVLYEWFQRAQKRLEFGVVTDQCFIRVAQNIKLIFSIQNFNPDQEWLDRFKATYNISGLDMRMLHIENNKSPPSVDINDIILYVLKKNPLSNFFSSISGAEIDIEMKMENELLSFAENDTETRLKNEEFLDMNMEVQKATISNDEQARLHLKPLEEYVLLKDNYQAMGHISQLMDIFSTEMKKEERC